MATFRKLADDTWGVLVRLDEVIQDNVSGEDDGLGGHHTPITGDTVTVTKRNGQTQTVILGELAGTEPVTLARIFKIAPRNPRPAPITQNIGNLSGILALFDRARQHLHYPAIVLSVPGWPVTNLIRISVAGERANVPGSLNVASLDEFVNGRRRWYGRVRQDGIFEQREGGSELANRLAQFAADPARVASEHGRLTGRCCFCHHALEDERSTAVGYGPVCADHFGLPWGIRPIEFAAPVAA